MSKPTKYIVSFLLGSVLAVTPVTWVVADDESVVPSITVVGSGKVSATPDQGQINVGVVTQRQAAVDAMSENSVAVRKIFQSLADLGIPGKDIQTNNLTLTPVYARRDQPRDPPKIIGYEVSNQVRITVRELARMGNVLDSVVREGANHLNGVSFAVADADQFLDKARKQAVQDARRKAEIYAGTAGVGLGSVLAVQEVQPHLPRPQQFRLAQAAESVPIAPGQLEFAVNITVIYRIDTGETK
jgi:uncharacterized protein